MPQQGKFTAADLDQAPPQSGQQMGQFNAADLDPSTAPAQQSWLQRTFSPRPVPRMSPSDISKTPLPGNAEGANLAEGLSDYDKASFGEMGGGARDIVRGDLAKGAHRIISGTAAGAAPIVLPLAAIGAPGVTAAAVTAGAAGQFAGKTAASALGANEDQSDLAGDVAGIAAAAGAAKLPGTRVGQVAGKVIKGAAEDIPGVRQFGKLREYWDATAPKPTTPSPEVTQAASLARGAQPVQDPAAGLGEIPVRPGAAGSIAQSMQQPQTPAPMQRGSLSQMMSNLQDQVGQGLGATPKPPAPAPNQPIYQRGGISSAMQEGDSNMLEGHTPVDSSWIKSYKYDPGTREFEMAPKTGTPVRLGDVSPEEAQAFGDAKSQGKAWQQIKNNVLVAKRINGKWVATKAAQ